MKSASSDQDIKITEDQVQRYLRNHPGFFLQNEDLLSEIKLSHNSGRAVSLLERQVEILRERNMEMRSRLNGLLENAQRNDRLFDKTKQLILALLEADSAESLAESFCHHLSRDFEVDFATLIVFQAPARLGGNRLRVRSLDEARSQIGGLLKSSNAVCGVLRPEENRFLFGSQGKEVGSTAMVPISSPQPLGLIAIASRDPNHFRSSMGTLFLSYIADVITRLLPQHLKADRARAV